MTAMMSPPAGYHFMPTTVTRSGILLNPSSPSSSAPNSPKRSSYLAPFPSNASTMGTHLVPLSSHSSASSSTSSTDDIISSTSATSAGGATLASSSSAAQNLPSRKIRFAPLPEPRRDYDYDDDLLSPGFFNEADSAASSPNSAALSLLSPPLSPNVVPPTPTRYAHLNESNPQSSCSTLGLSLDGAELPDSGQATETNTIVGSDCGTDETHTAANSKKKRWSRLLRLPKATPLRVSSRTPDEHLGQFSLWRSSSRESNASACSSRAGALGHIFGSMSDTNASSASLGNPLSRRKTANGTDSVPISPSISFHGGLSLKPVVSEAGTAATPTPRGKAHSHTDSAPPSVRRGTRLLNGRIYGSKRPGSAGAAKNPFANIRDTEPEFVEWGHGGMGSVQNGAGAGSSQWTRLQSNKRVSVGHEDGTTGAVDDDDGSGMGWVKRRREARERERKEREEREAKETAEGKDVTGNGDAKPETADTNVEQSAVELEMQVVTEPSKTDSESSVKEIPGPVAPTDASEEKEDRISHAVDEADENRDSKEEKERKEKEHIYTAVTVPAPRRHHHSRSHSLTGSVLTSPVHSVLGTPTNETHSHVLGSSTNTPLGTPGASTGIGPSPLALASVGAAADETSTPGSSASSSFEEEESPVADKDEDKDIDDDDDDEDEEDEQARKTAIGAGVEKISRHKD